MRLTRRYRFSASHRLHSSSLSEGDNARIYGKCNNPFGHGHDYVLEVVVRGSLDESGRVVDLRSLDDLVRREVVAPFEHSNLNTDVPEFSSAVPTSENLAVVAGNRLRSVWRKTFESGPALEKVRIRETRRNIFELAI